MSSFLGKGQTALRNLMGYVTSGPRATKYFLSEVGDLQDGQMKEIPIESAEGQTFKVLLSKIQGEFYVTSHLCPHYKARLVTGTLSSDGRLTCPWHAACFNVKNGDIEEAPSLASLTKYQTIIEDGKVYIFANLDDFKNPTRMSCDQLNIKEDQNDSRVFVILGGGAAGAVAAESIRQNGFTGRLVLISKEPYPPIDRIKLSKILDAQPENLQLYSNDYFKKLKVDLLLGRAVVKLNKSENEVMLADGEKIKYDKLLISTGGDPRTLPISRNNLKNIFTIRSIRNNEEISKAIQGFVKPKTVVIGASFIGMEAAAMLSKLSESVTVVGIEKTPLERVLGDQVGSVFKRLHEKNGIKFKLGATISGFIPNESEGERVGYVELGDSTRLPADIVILGVGVRPQTEFCEGSIPLGADGSIQVDSNMKVSDAENIYAAGDLATFPYHKNGLPVRIEHWDVAQQQGRIAGHNMAKPESPQPYQSIPFFWTMQFGKSVRYAGMAHGGYDHVEIVGNLESDSPAFAAYYCKGDVVLAVATMGMDPLAIHCSELWRLDRMISLTELKSGKDPMTIKV